MKKISYFVLLFSFVLLFGCAKNTKIPEKPPTCLSICQQYFNQCTINCRNNCKDCTAESKAKAAEHFRYYLHEQYVQGVAVTRNLQSYRDPLQCRKVTCNCAADIKNCRQGCSNLTH